VSRGAKVAVKTSNPRKVLVEWRYKPVLAFYGHMDLVGTALRDEFPDWQRSPLTLELRNKVAHRRLFLSYTRAFVECDGPGDLEGEVQLLLDVHEKVREHLSLESYTRVGIRQWFALTFGHDFRNIVKRLHKRFYVSDDNVEKIYGGKVKDLAYAVDLEAEEGWECHFRLGPMQRKQWFEVVQYEKAVFQRQGEHSFEELEKSLPEALLYVDLDYYCQDVAAKQFADRVHDAQRRAASTVRQCIEYYRG
jgi:hypothetical protein